MSIRKLLSSLWLMGITLLIIVAVHLYLCLAWEENHWFERSGSLIVLVGIWITARRIIRLGDKHLNEDWNLPNQTQEGRQVRYDHMAQYRFGPIVAFLGTIVWGYGEIFIGWIRFMGVE